MCVGSCRGQRVPDPLQLESQAVVSCLKWFWERNPSPLQEQQVPLTAKPLCGPIHGHFTPTSKAHPAVKAFVLSAGSSSRLLETCMIAGLVSPENRVVFKSLSVTLFSASWVLISVYTGAGTSRTRNADHGPFPCKVPSFLALYPDHIDLRFLSLFLETSDWQKAGSSSRFLFPFPP